MPRSGLRRHLAGLLSGVIGLGAFQCWFWTNSIALGQQGRDEDIALLRLVGNRCSEYTSDSIDAAELLDAVQTDSLVAKELLARRSAVA